MKRIYLLFAMCSLTFGQAQVPNNGFEEILSDGFSPKNWGSVFIQPVHIDLTTGESMSDEIWFQGVNSFTMAAGDCLTGSWSLMVSNAYNATQETTIPGHAVLFNDELSETANGWNSGIPLPDGAVVQFLGFDYKFMPMGNDVAAAKMELFNENSESIGVAEITLLPQPDNFQYVYVPVAFTMDDTPKFMTITFSMQKDDSEVNFGSVLFVDNVVVNTAMLGVRQPENRAFTVYPTIAENQLNIMANAADLGEVSATILNLEGKTVAQQKVAFNGSAGSIDVSALSSGTYLLDIRNGSDNQVTRFIKK
ncbi:T9SS type A sorting domain-containing protein [Flavobacterium longum]|uniref:T9SS type A sorting domain-containing protein n=1 Tax=Flavobacterium longum TaxID=1299340 RepID=UPI0039EAB529